MCRHGTGTFQCQFSCGTEIYLQLQKMFSSVKLLIKNRNIRIKLIKEELNCHSG